MARRIPSEFVPLDVHYARDRAIRCVGVAGEVLFIRSLAAARLHKSGGFVADFDLSSLTFGIRRPAEVVRALVREGLWLEVDGGWSIRSWEKWNGTKDEVNAEKAAESEGGARGNHQRWHEARGITAPDCAYCPPDSGANRVPDQSTDRGRIGVASQKEKEKEKERTTRPAEPDTFDEWWQAYPRKEGKGRARPAYAKALRDVPADKLLRLTLEWFQARPDIEPQFVPQPASWLNARRWEDEAPLARPGAARPGSSVWDRRPTREGEARP